MSLKIPFFTYFINEIRIESVSDVVGTNILSVLQVIDYSVVLNWCESYVMRRTSSTCQENSRAV